MNDNLLTQEEFAEFMIQAEVENRKSILMFEDRDGNWRGATRISGAFINVRAGDPNTVLTALLTHDGTK